jgi:hypothetical protein
MTTLPPSAQGVTITASGHGHQLLLSDIGGHEVHGARSRTRARTKAGLAEPDDQSRASRQEQVRLETCARVPGAPAFTSRGLRKASVRVDRAALKLLVGRFLDLVESEAPW